MSTIGTGIRRTRKVATYERFCAVDFDRSQKGALVASFARNCDFENGALRSGFGVKRYYLESQPENALPSALTGYGQPKIVFTALIRTADGNVKRTVGLQSEMNHVYIYDIDGDAVVYVGTFEDVMRVISYVCPDGTPKVVFCAVDQLVVYEFPNKTNKVLEGKLTGACVFHERLFVATKHSLAYSAPTEIENFEPTLNGGGEIAFDSERGDIVWVESLGESMYVFFEYGLAKLTASGAGSEFVVTNIPYNSGKILARTVSVFEDKLVFASVEGVFVFDGRKCTKIKTVGLAPIKNNTLRASAGCLEGRYVLGYADEQGNRRSLFVDLADEKNQGECFFVCGLNESGGKVMCLSDYEYSYLDRAGDLPQQEEYSFKVSACDFGSRAEKSIKYLCLQGVGSCVVKVKGRSGVRTISFDLGTRESVGIDGEINVNGADVVGGKRKIVGLKGREFAFEITLQKGCVIRKMSVEYDELGGVK